MSFQLIIKVEYRVNLNKKYKAEYLNVNQYRSLRIDF
ncbi:hypothetical protein Xind_02711 [Xenorhabdus indica]|nr:hypothetical protein [Xenorhabdus indica]